ncbi:peptidase family M1-domain-containing protein [Nemania sp. NC0429]|nr:peptidase family M1-domain-containing protein [Nemania sp. NC0429]
MDQPQPVLTSLPPAPRLHPLGIAMAPLEYHLYVKPNDTYFEFDGVVLIKIVVFARTNVVPLKSAGLLIRAAKYRIGSNTSNRDRRWTTAEFACYAEDQLACFFLETAAQKGSIVTLRVTYTGPIYEGVFGLYESVYEDEDNHKHSYLAIQLAPNYAHWVFPCFEGRKFKTNFTLKIECYKHLKCLSNTKQTVDIPMDDEYSLRVFERTPKMSIHNLSFVIGEFDRTFSERSHIVAMWYPRSCHLNADWAVEAAEHGAKYADTMLGWAYPMYKIDIVALPDLADNSANMGLIICGMNTLTDPENPSRVDELPISEVIVRSVCQSWISGCVTMKLWKFYWFEDAMATYLSFIVLGDLPRGASLWNKFVIDIMQSVMELDALENSHAVELPIEDAAQSRAAYDSISCMKGACLIRMMSNVATRKVFEAAIRDYLAEYNMQTVTPDYFWICLERRTRKPIRHLMEAWTGKAGFPLITVVKETEYKEADLFFGYDLVLQKKRYFSDKKRIDDVEYPVWLTIHVNDGVEEHLFAGDRLRIRLKNTHFYNINAEHAGFFRVAYQKKTLERFGTPAVADKLPCVEKIGILADVTALMISGHQTTVEVLGLLMLMRQERDHGVWPQMLRVLGRIQNAWLFEDEATRKSLDDFAGATAKLMILDGRDYDDPEAMSDLEDVEPTLLKMAGAMGQPEVIEKCRELVQKYVDGDRDMSPHLRDVALEVVLRHAEPDDFQKVLKLYRDMEEGDEKLLILSKLAYVSSPAYIREVLDLVLTGAVEDEDVYIALYGLGSSRAGVEEGWKWAKAKWPRIVQKMGNCLLRGVIPLVVGGLSTREQLLDVEEFFAQQHTSGFLTELERELERLQIKVAWVERDSVPVRELLRGWYFA